MAGPVPGALGIVEENDVRVPMRDGITLSSDVLRPDAPGAFPGLLLRSPYGRRAIAYADFEGEIAEGQYGAGRVEVWDAGEYEPLASEEGCVLAWAGPPDRHASLPDRLATALEPFQPAGLAGLVRAEPGLPASRVMEAMVAMQGVGLEPVYATRIEEAEAECEGGVSGREELVARLEEVLRAAAAAEP